MIDFEFRAPESVDELSAALDDLGDDARVLAGGTALVLLMKQRLVQPRVLLSLRRLNELSSIERLDGQIRIGALATHRQVEEHSDVREHLPVLSEALRRVATPRIRNQATLAGNLAHADPNQDPPPTLIVLGASVRLRSSVGAREIPVEELFVDYYETALRPGEILTDILIPLPSAGSAGAFLKFLPRSADDYATASAAASVRLDGGICRDVRLALGSAGPIPIRARGAEVLLEGQVPTEDALRAAAATVTEAVDPLSDVRGSAEYKREMAEVFAYRALKRAVERSAASQR